jgi:hypothetical protein
VEGVHFGGVADLALVEAQAPTILRLGLGIPSLALPLPERPLPAGRRLPRLAAHARDEREAAIELALRGLEAAATLGRGSGCCISRGDARVAGRRSGAGVRAA